VRVAVHRQRCSFLLFFLFIFFALSLSFKTQNAIWEQRGSGDGERRLIGFLIQLQKAGNQSALEEQKGREASGFIDMLKLLFFYLRNTKIIHRSKCHQSFSSSREN